MLALHHICQRIKSLAHDADLNHVMAGFEMSAYLISTTQPDPGPPTPQSSDDYCRRVCVACHRREAELDENEERQFRKLLIALNLDPGLVSHVKSYQCGCCRIIDKDHEEDITVNNPPVSEVINESIDPSI